MSKDVSTKDQNSSKIKGFRMPHNIYNTYYYYCYHEYIDLYSSCWRIQ